jgi:hypothetical protein
VGIGIAELARRSASESARARQRVEQFQEPLLAAAYELQSRLWNILCGNFLQQYARQGRSDLEERYAVDSTVWLVAQYFGCMELVRREAPFVPVANIKDRGQLQARLDAVRGAFASDATITGSVFRVHRAWQRAIGEVMIVRDPQSDGLPRTRCMGFAEFTKELDDSGSEVSKWCSELMKDVEIRIDDPASFDRVREVQHALVRLVELLDPDSRYYPNARTEAARS